MLTLAHYGNKLPGTEPPLTDEQVKKHIILFFSLLWQQQFILSGQHVATTTLSDISEFMSKEKLFADLQNSVHAHDKKKPFQQKDDLPQGSFKKRKHNKGKKLNLPFKKNKEFPLSVAKKANDKKGPSFFKSLFDSGGGTSVMINKRAIPKDCEIFDNNPGEFHIPRFCLSFRPGHVQVYFNSKDQEDQSICFHCAKCSL
jgi:hypothetical protein